jgi:hypothetical protein
MSLVTVEDNKLLKILRAAQLTVPRLHAWAIL